VMSVKLGDKHPSYSSQKLGLLDLEQTIWAVKMKNVLGELLKWQFQ
jgi:hypothetical protein